MQHTPYTTKSYGMVGSSQNEGAVVIFVPKKVKAPLLRGGKNACAAIHNNIPLLESYAFVMAALAKFPTIFNIEKAKKGFFPHTFNHPYFWKYRGLMPHSDYY